MFTALAFLIERSFNILSRKDGTAKAEMSVPEQAFDVATEFAIALTGPQNRARLTFVRR
jgi:hypothetical protein